MRSSAIAIAAVLAGGCFCAAHAAGGSTGGGKVDTGRASSGFQSSGVDWNYEVDKTVFRNKLKQRRLEGKSADELKKIDIADVSALVKAAALSCDVINAELVLEGKETVDGKDVGTRTFEAACGNGLGYFLMDRGTHPGGMTCFAADASHAADVKAGVRNPSPACQLAESAEPKAMAANILKHAAKGCSVREIRWIGTSPASNTDFTEVACTDATGYILANPLPGSALSPRVVACHEAAMQGMPCKLTDNGTIVTLQTFKDEIIKRQVACDITDVRLIGKQPLSKRHVVEFACKNRPDGLVAFIPFEGSGAVFETVSCADAPKHGAVCKLTPAKP